MAYPSDGRASLLRVRELGVAIISWGRELFERLRRACCRLRYVRLVDHGEAESGVG